MKILALLMGVVLLTGCSHTPELSQSRYQTNWLKDDLGEFPVVLEKR